MLFRYTSRLFRSQFLTLARPLSTSTVRPSTRSSSSSSASTHNFGFKGTLTIGSIVAVGAISGLVGPSSAEAKSAPTSTDLGQQPGNVVVGSHLPGLQEYSREEVSKHCGEGSGVWVVYKSGVYDVTEFVEQHPGGDVILTAAGQDIEPFWDLYQQHNEAWVGELLEKYRVGNLTKGEERTVKMRDPKGKNDVWSAEPDRSPLLCVRSEKPFNAEPPLGLLIAEQITPNKLFYVRNHLPVPVVDEKTYALEICREDGNVVKRVTLDDLKTKFEKVEVPAAIQCAGNRRNEMAAHKPVRGGKWEVGAISNAVWGGARLTDVLQYAGVPVGEEYGHIHFVGLDKDVATKSPYAASIPTDVLKRHRKVILAYEMNGEELPRDHGYPVRAIAPGIVGARNVKWVGKVVVSSEECDSHWQKRDYKGFSPNVDWHNVNFDTAPPIQEMPVNSAICTYSVGEGSVSMAGYAWSGDGKGIIRVDVSIDGGKTWLPAQLGAKEESRNEIYDWTLWEAEIELPENGVDNIELVCKAIDSAYNTQPDTVGPIWNLRGVLNNSWHRVAVTQSTT